MKKGSFFNLVKGSDRKKIGEIFIYEEQREYERGENPHEGLQKCLSDHVDLENQESREGEPE